MGGFLPYKSIEKKITISHHMPVGSNVHDLKCCTLVGISCVGD